MPAAVLRLSERSAALACGMVTRQASPISSCSQAGAPSPSLPKTSPSSSAKARRHRARPKCGPIRVLVDVERSPVIHARTAKVAVVDLEPERPDEMQPRAGERTQAANIASVLWDLRREKCYMKHAE
jgi:hypothetical protein